MTDMFDLPHAFYFKKLHKKWFVVHWFHAEDMTNEEVAAKFPAGTEILVQRANGGGVKRVINSLYKVTSGADGARFAYFAVDENARKKRIFVVADVFEPGDVVAGVKVDGFGKKWTTTKATAFKRDVNGYEKLDGEPKKFEVCYAYGVGVPGYKKPTTKRVPVSEVKSKRYVSKGAGGNTVSYEFRSCGLYAGWANRVEGGYEFFGFEGGARKFPTLKAIKEAIASGKFKLDREHQGVRDDDQDDQLAREEDRRDNYKRIEMRETVRRLRNEMWRNRNADHPRYGAA